MSEMESVDGRRYAPVGKCIYCGSTDDLTDEHTIPLGLSGTALLPDASCKPCAKITGKFEGDVLRGPMQQVRVLRELRSRSKHKEAPKSKEYQITKKNGEVESVQFGFADSPVVFSFPVFDVPAYLNPDGYISGIRMAGIATYAFGTSPEDAMRAMQVTDLSWTESHRYHSFARILAKIAYASAIGQAREAGILEPFPEIPEVVASILGHKNEIGRWVGTMTKPFERHDGHLHRVSFGSLPDGAAVAELQLFADSGTPHYGVILGPSNVKL